MPESSTSRSLRIFLCHSSADKPAVRELYRRLHADGFAPWLDEEDLLPGQDWQREIPKAVRYSDVVIVCLSRGSINKAGYIQKEIKFALDVADEQPEDTIFLIPLKLEECDVPDRLSRWQWVNLFSPKEYERLVRALQARATSLGLVVSPIQSSAASAPQSSTDTGSQTSRNNALANDTPAVGVATIPTGPLFPRIIFVPQLWKCPAVEDVFDSGEYAIPNEEDLREKVDTIDDTLRAFGVEGKVVKVNCGAAITRFDVELGFVKHNGKLARVKINQITALNADLKLALAAKTIHIEAVSGKNTVSIEIPNKKISTVVLRDVIESESFHKLKRKGALPIALGQDVSGQAIAANLATMPPLLIAGKMDSGKSACVNAIIACLMTQFTPDELRFLMVNLKRVELTSYNGVPHLLAPVVVDPEKVAGVLNWVTREMDERYRKFAKNGSRTIHDYNTRIEQNNARERARQEPILPCIVVIIDGLADLMMRAPDEIEQTICRLAQNARATGIHLIVTAQPNVVTRWIKAHFLARIALSVASANDSRAILDTVGAERLLGNGDMFYIVPELGSPQRLQGCFVSEKEIHKLVRYWKDQIIAQTAIEETNVSDEDELLQRAINVVKQQKKASASLLQRKLRIGYPRAAYLIDQMEKTGIVGPAKEDGRSRDVLSDDRYSDDEN